MRFINQAEKGRGNFGTYLLTIAVVFFTMIVVQVISELICLKTLHHSLTAIPNDANYNTILVLLMSPFAAALIALALCVKHIHKQPILTLFTSRDQFDWKRFFTSFSIWGGVMAVFLFIGVLLGVDVYWNYNSQTFWMLLLISFMIIPLQTSMEETFFRGYLMQGFGKITKHIWLPIVTTGILFGLLHGANPEVAVLGYGILAYYIMTGVFLGILTHMDDGLELGLGYHAVNNIFAAVVLTNDWQAFHTDALFIDKAIPVFGWESLITILVLQPLLLIAFSKIYNWGNWKDKFLSKM